MDSIIAILESARSFVLSTGSALMGNMSLDLGIKILLAYFFIIWGSFVIWVIKDITNRTSNIFVQTLSIFIILFFTPIFGLPIYLLIRPRSTIFEQYFEENNVEEEEVEEYLHHCPKCNHPVSEDFHFCPKCATKLARVCSSCGKDIRTDWLVCPYCGHDDTTEEKMKKKTKKLEDPVKKKESVPEAIPEKPSEMPEAPVVETPKTEAPREEPKIPQVPQELLRDHE